MYVFRVSGCGLGFRGFGFRDFSSHVLQRFFEAFGCVAVAFIVAGFVVVFVVAVAVALCVVVEGR